MKSVTDSNGKEVSLENGVLTIDVINLDPQGRTMIVLDKKSMRELAEAMLAWASEAPTHHSFVATNLTVEQPKLKI